MSQSPAGLSRSSLLPKGLFKKGVTWGLLLPLLSACSLTGVYKERVTKSFEGRCAPKETVLRSVPLAELTISAQKTQQLAHPLRKPLEKIPIQGFSWRSVQAARLIGIAPLLKRMAGLESEEGQKQPNAELQLLKVRHQIVSRIALADLEVTSMTAQAACEEARAREVADRLLKSALIRARQLGVVAIVIGGVTSIVTGGLGLASSGGSIVDIASIVGGALGATFGTWALYPSNEQQFETPASLLREVWEGPEHSTLFPESVWSFLNSPMREEEDSRTFREELIAGWQQEGRLGHPGTQEMELRKQLVFSDGGLYEGEDLFARAQMLMMLETTIGLLHQDLERLLREVLIREAIIEDTPTK